MSMSRIGRIVLLALAAAPPLAAPLLLPAPAAAQLPHARITDAARTQAGDTLVLRFSLRGEPAVQVSEPFHLGDRVRLYLDMHQAASLVDSAALAHLQGDNLIAVVPRPRAGGVALVVDLHRLAEYRIHQDAATVTLRLLARQPAPAVAAAPAAPAPVVSAPAASGLPMPHNPLLLLAIAPVALLLLALHRRRTPVPARSEPTPSPVSVPAALPAPEPGRGSGRVWAARTLAANGATTADVVRRTGMPREAIRFLHEDTPAVSAAPGTNGRQQAPVYPPPNGVRTR